jgi:hypothetical protein
MSEKMTTTSQFDLGVTEQDAQLLEQVREILARPVPKFAAELVYLAQEERQLEFRAMLAGTVKPRKPHQLMYARRINQRLVYLINNLDKWPAPIPIEAVHVSKPVDMAGDMLDPVWGDAKVYPLSYRCNWAEKVGVSPGSARVLWDETYLYLGYEFIKHGVYAPLFPRNGAVYEHDCAELFFRPDVNTQRYYEINPSPSGSIYDAALDKDPNGWYGECDVNFDVQNLKLGWKIWDGTHRADGLSRYTLEMAVPWSEVLPGNIKAVAGAKMQALLAGSVEFDMNRDFEHGYYCHSPMLSHFHNPDGFAPMTLV